METAGRAYLKEQKEKASYQSILEIVDALEGKLFDVFKEAPEAHQGAQTGSFQMLAPRIHKLSFPTYMMVRRIRFGGSIAASSSQGSKDPEE